MKPLAKAPLMDPQVPGVVGQRGNAGPGVGSLRAAPKAQMEMGSVSSRLAV